MANVLFLSPHLDDAVFSCALQILRTSEQGLQPLVATVFSHGKAGAGGVDSHAGRREEDRSALALLGAQPEWLGLLDAPWRNAFYHSFQHIVLGTAAGDEHTAAEAGSAIKSLLKRIRPVALYCPLAIGTHIDHRHVFNAVRQWRLKLPVHYYEDRPYAYIRHHAEMRLAEINGTNVGKPWPAFVQSFRTAPYVRRYLPPGGERRRVEAILKAKFSQGSGRATRWKSHVLAGRDDEQRIINTALRAYESQIADFLGDPSKLRRRDREHASTLGKKTWRAERTWSSA